MKIVLTHGYFLEEDVREQEIMKPYPPLGLLYVSAYLEAGGFPNQVYDTTFSGFADLTAYLDRERPGLLGIYTNLMTKVNVLRIIRHVREQAGMEQVRIVLGGPEVRHHREAFLASGADVIVYGEGEATMLDLARHYSGEAPEALTQIPGIAFTRPDGLHSTGERPFLPDIDHLPLPSREKIDLNKYLKIWRNYHGYGMVSINTMRGCPYACSWCSRAVYGKSYRRRSPERVVEEIAHLQLAFPFDRIWFVDDVFTINHRWLREFAGLLKARGIRISYEAITRADRMNEEVVRLLRDSGCFRIWIGAESGSQAVLDAMNRMVKVEKVAEMIRLSREHGIEAGTFIMLGYPGETQRDIRATLDYLLSARPDHFTLTTAYPIKGTGLYEEAEPMFTTSLPWESSTDRDIDFRRTYPRPYYEHAANWIRREVAASRAFRGGSLLAGLRIKLAALRSRAAMALIRILVRRPAPVAK